MERKRLLSPLLRSTWAIIVAISCLCLCRAQVMIPPQVDGFRLSGVMPDPGSIVVEAFLDALCPDSRVAWPALKEAVAYYQPRLRVAIHTYPQSFYDNAYLASHALHVANIINSSTALPLLEEFFKHQEKYSNEATRGTPRISIITDVINFTASAVGPGAGAVATVRSVYDDPISDRASRMAFKYGSSRGITHAPTFVVNGFQLPDADVGPLNLTAWRRIIDPLLTVTKP